MTGENADQPYSPKQTCGKCHDYDKITEGYHFTQGAGEPPTADQGARCQWALTPGNYGGTWCSPAPLYRYLSPKHNASAATMDLTSFTFLTEGCGACHPGGGPAEYDREGKRYDDWMSDPASGLTPGGDNTFDGDYHKARWSESGVLEADCLLCHLPGYDYAERVRQIGLWNLRWAAAAGARLAVASGALKQGTPVTLVYDKSRFNPDGTIELNMVRSPRNEACLSCHAQPGWKKRGANYGARTDVHLRAGLRCVDCHPAGSSATDPRISGHELHQIAKGDDPGGHVRDELDDTVVGCADCHDTGRLGAPLAPHRWLPALHLERIACQTCHIPARVVMPISVQASDVFNPAPRISGGKRLWTFYGPDGAYRNHYGFLGMMGYDDKPTEVFRPVLARYKGKIYPVNRVHTAWPGIEIEGQSGLMQPRMGDIMKLWTAHRADPSKYPQLAAITDDNGDGVPEVNRPAEIDALLAAVSQLLQDVQYPMEGKRAVWVTNDRVYSSGETFRTVDKQPWEASPYGNVHKYSHDVYPARAALGSDGCRDCHSPSSPFYHAAVFAYPFGEDAQPVWGPQYQLLGIGSLAAAASGWRESYLKPFGVWAVAATCIVLLLHLTLVGVHGAPDGARAGANGTRERFCRLERLAHLALFVSFIGLAVTGFSFLLRESGPLGQGARWLHGWLGWLFTAGLVAVFLCWAKDMRFRQEDGTWMRALGGYLWDAGRLPAGKFNAGQKVYFWFAALAGAVLVVTGGLLFFQPGGAAGNLSLWYFAHDLAAVLVLPAVLAHLYLGLIANPGTVGSIFGGRVREAWIAQQHPDWTGADARE